MLFKLLSVKIRIKDKFVIWVLAPMKYMLFLHWMFPAQNKSPLPRTGI